MGFEVNVHVPLGLVERKQQQRRDGNIELNQLYQLDREVIAKTYQHDEFLTEVIGQRQARKNKNIAIVGEPGAGKTTLLGAIASFIQSNTEYLPICITLASLQGRTLEEYLLKTWLSEAMGLVNPEVVVTPEIKNELIKQFRKGGVWLLLDGVDEMGADSPIQALATIQKQLTDWLGQARVVLTCRLNIWDASVNNTLTGFDTYRTQEFTHEQIDLFIQEWFACAGKPQRGEQLQAKLKEPGRERIRELVEHPLRLALLCQIFYLDKQETLPETKAALYERFTRYFYEWKQNLYPKDLINWDELHQALGKLALAGINSKTRFRLKQSLAIQEMGKPLFKLAADLGWLNLIERDTQTDEPVYAFYHPTFQEYFAALNIDDWDYFLPGEHNNQNLKPVRDTYRVFERQWKEVFLLWLGREDVPKPKKEEIIKALVDFKDGCKDFYGYRAYFIAAAGIAEFDDFSNSEKIVRLIVECGFGYFNGEEPNWITRNSSIAEAAREVLKDTVRKKVILALAQLLHPEHCEVTRSLVAVSLLEFDPENKAAFTALLQLIECAEDKLSRFLAVASLAKIDPGNKTLLTALLNVIESEEDKFIRCMAATILVTIDPGNQTALTTLIQLLQKFQYDKSIFAAELSELWEQFFQGNVPGIANLSNFFEAFMKLVPILVSMNLQKFDPDNKTMLDTLAQIQAQPLEQARESINILENDPGNESALNTLVELVEKIANDNIYREKFESLRQTDPDQQTKYINWIVQLIGMIKDEDIRRRAAESLAKIDPGNETALNMLVQLIETTDDESLCKRTAESLAKIDPGNETALNTLVQLIETTDDQDICCQAAKSLREIDPGNETALNTLVDLIETTDNENIRLQAAGSLEKILQGDQFPEVVAALNGYLTDQVYKDNLIFYMTCHSVIWHSTENMSYPEFYRAWHSKPSPEVQALEKQFTDHASQVQPTDKTYPIVINAQALEGETDTNSIAQALSNRIYRFVFPDDSEIPPEVSNAYQLERSLLQLKKQLQKQNLALILDKCEPNQALITFCRKLTDVLHIAWITNQPLEPPLKGFPPEQANLLSALQNWIKEIG
jgi:HEAT repeat protein